MWLASLIARYAVPSDTLKTLAIFLTDIFDPTDNDSMCASICSCLVIFCTSCLLVLILIL